MRLFRNYGLITSQVGKKRKQLSSIEVSKLETQFHAQIHIVSNKLHQTELCILFLQFSSLTERILSKAHSHFCLADIVRVLLRCLTKLGLCCSWCSSSFSCTFAAASSAIFLASSFWAATLFGCRGPPGLG